MVFEEPSLSKNVRVDKDGTILLPLMTKKVAAEGLLPRDLETMIAHALVDEQLLVHPVVTVSILQYAVRMITVVGDVRVPGQFTISAPITLLEALAKAGWVTNDAGPEVLVSKDAQEQPEKISIAQLLQNSGPSVNLQMTGGEVVNVPDAAKALAARFRKARKSG